MNGKTSCSNASNQSIATERDEDILWHMKQIVAAEARDGEWIYLVAYKDSTIGWQYFNAQEIDGHKLVTFASDHRKQGEYCMVRWKPRWQSAESVPESFAREFWIKNGHWDKTPTATNGLECVGSQQGCVVSHGTGAESLECVDVQQPPQTGLAHEAVA